MLVFYISQRIAFVLKYDNSILAIESVAYIYSFGRKGCEVIDGRHGMGKCGYKNWKEVFFSS